jgi:hypothetical protein
MVPGAVIELDQRDCTVIVRWSQARAGGDVWLAQRGRAFPVVEFFVQLTSMGFHGTDPATLPRRPFRASSQMLDDMTRVFDPVGREVARLGCRSAS